MVHGQTYNKNYLNKNEVLLDTKFQAWILYSLQSHILSLESLEKLESLKSLGSIESLWQNSI